MATNDSGIPNPVPGTGNLPNFNPNAQGGSQPTNPALTGINPTDLMSAIQSQLSSSSGAISSSSSNIEGVINDAISKTQSSADSTKKATTISYDKQISDATDAAQQQETAYLNAQGGYATNVAALRDLRTNNAKDIQKLEDSKQQALAVSDAASASKISDLIIQKYQFEQQAQQQTFSNLISLNNLAIQNAQEARLNKTESFNEESSVQNIALKYGLNVPAGTSLADVVKLAKPLATKEEQLQLDQAASQIALNNANTKKALADAQQSLAAAGKGSTDLNSNDFNVTIKAAIAADPKATADSVKAKIQSITGLTAAQRQLGYDAVDTYFAQKAAANVAPGSSGIIAHSLSSPFLNTVATGGNIVTGISNAISQFFTGNNAPFN